jgi:hypothetical protein
MADKYINPIDALKEATVPQVLKDNLMEIYYKGQEDYKQKVKEAIDKVMSSYDASDLGWVEQLEKELGLEGD